MHDYHDGLPGYSPTQVLIDGCGECEQRAQNSDHGIGNLDRGNFALAWHRAAVWHQEGLPDLAEAEMPMLRVMWAIQLHLERYGIPIGMPAVVPTGTGWPDGADYCTGAPCYRNHTHRGLAPDDPPEYDPDDAEAQRIAEVTPMPAPNRTGGRGA